MPVHLCSGNARHSLEREFLPLGPLEELEVEVTGDGSAGSLAVVEADEVGQTAGQVEQIVENLADRLRRRTGCATNPSLRLMVAASDRHVHRHQRKRVHPGDVVEFADAEVVADFDAALSPANVLPTQEAAAVFGGRAVGR